MDVIYKVETDAYQHGFMQGKTVVYSDIPDEEQAYLNAMPSLADAVPNISGDEVKGARYVPPVPRAVTLTLEADRYSVVLKEGEVAVIEITSSATDQYGNAYEVDAPKSVTIDSVGDHIVKATAGDLSTEVTIAAYAYAEPSDDSLSLEERLFDLEKIIVYLTL